MARNSGFWHWAQRVLHTQAFRITLVFVFFYVISATTLVAFTWWNAQRALDAQTDDTIEAEVSGLREQYQRLGVIGLSDVITGRVGQHGSGLYLLQSPTDSVLAGNLIELPTSAKTLGRFVEFDYKRNLDGKEVTRAARGRAFFLQGGFRLLVGRDISDQQLSRRLFTTTLPWSVGLMLLLIAGKWSLIPAALNFLVAVARSRIIGGKVS